MKYLLLTLFVISVTSNKIIAQNDKNTFQSVVVLELFTSQGCSSCPPADKLLEEVKREYQNKDVIALSYHVDYWNYLGWKDPYSKSAYSEKQRAYGTKFTNGSIYTPQMVVNGIEGFVGSKRSTLYGKIKEYRNKKADHKITISNVKKNNNKVEFNYEVEGSISNKKLKVILVIDERTTYVKSGENRSRTLKNSNIVVNETQIALNDHSGSGSIAIGNEVKSSDELSLVVLVEDNHLDIETGTLVKL